MDHSSSSSSSLKSGISVIICTYNGAQKLPETIKALSDQIVPLEIAWEIVLVDNNSSDDSAQIAQDWWNRNPKPGVSLHVLNEDQPGKYYALNKGLKQASFKYFIIADDDNRLAPNYVHLAFEIINSTPQAGAIGSQSIPVFEENAVVPDWFKKNTERFAVGEQGITGDVTHRKHLWGAGLISRTGLYLQIYQQYPSLLVEDSSKKILIAEDTEYCLRLILRGFQLHYCAALLLYHFVPNERLSKAYWQKLDGNIEQSFEIIDAYYTATKIFTKKYQKTSQKLRLKLLTPIRFLISRGSKKRRQRFLLGLLFPESKYHTPLIKKIISFVEDQQLPREIY